MLPSPKIRLLTSLQELALSPGKLARLTCVSTCQLPHQISSVNKDVFCHMMYASVTWQYEPARMNQANFDSAYQGAAALRSTLNPTDFGFWSNQPINLYLDCPKSLITHLCQGALQTVRRMIKVGKCHHYMWSQTNHSDLNQRFFFVIDSDRVGQTDIVVSSR